MCLSLFMLILFITGCQDRNTMNGPLYPGRPLNIGVIGDAPDVRETTVTFMPLTLNELEKNSDKLAGQFDAVFITKDYFREASEQKYKEAYKKSGIPILFIKLDKLGVAYTLNDLTYDDVPDAINKSLATGIYYASAAKEATQWEFGLYNDVENNTNVKSAYSGIFSFIEKRRLQN
ncbi:hypothetical protein ACTHPF_25050 [Paenibacillus sp. SAF-054]|uniref:hypothetical protein n=1 Tax=unclassified Paenibacillus TaxID=185978 RepID=UPI003F7F6A4B